MTQKNLYFAVIPCLMLFSAAIPYSQMTALQRHVSFFDADRDGLISVSDTAQGLQKLGIGCAAAYSSAVAIHAGLVGQAGVSFWEPLVLDISLIHRGKHKSDTGIYDDSGNFVEERFNQLFKQYFDIPSYSGNEAAISEIAFGQMIRDHKADFMGNLASKAEFSLLFKLAGADHTLFGEPTKKISKSRLRSFYQGDLFYIVAGEQVPQD